jgi:hypothetical protein
MMIKSRRMRRTGHVEERGDIGLWWESQKERDKQEVLDLGGRIQLTWILQK